MSERIERTWKVKCWRCEVEFDRYANIQDGGMCIPCFQESFTAWLKSVDLTRDRLAQRGKE